jgi:hypothetical protein
VNDDVFFGRDTAPVLFFAPSGIAKVFPSAGRRPFGDVTATDSLADATAKHHRRLLEDEFGRTLSRLVKHTPHPMIRSVVAEIGERFTEQIERTRRNKFRHPGDIVLDLFHHHYAQITGRAVPGDIRYTYVNIGDRSHQGALDTLLSQRDQDVFCLNDAPRAGAQGIDDEEIAAFLESYFPVPSRWELA